MLLREGRCLRRLAALIIVAILAASAMAQVQEAAHWKPDRPVRVIISGAAGSGADIAVRLIVPHMADYARTAMIIENIVGGGGATGVIAAARSEPDGYTLLAAVSLSGVLLNSLINPATPYDLFRDLVPVSQVSRSSGVLMVNNTVPAYTLEEFVTLARAAPGKFDMGNFGFGTSSHLQGAMLARRIGAQWQAVPFQSSPPLLRDLMAGHICCGISDIGSAREFLANNTLRPLAVSGISRSPVLPDVPTFAENGIIGLDQEIWQGLFAPAGTPSAIVKFWSAALAAALHDAGVIQVFQQNGSQGVGSTPAGFAAFLHDQRDRWKKAVDETGIRIT
jgi:tripartite-type tricarboxylate transporter receptor subunit TctC